MSSLLRGKLGSQSFGIGHKLREKLDNPSRAALSHNRQSFLFQNRTANSVALSYNRRGQLGNQMMIFPFLFLIFIISVGIVAGVYLFFGAGYDFREVDAELLNYKVRKCIVEGEIGAEFWSDFFEKCGIDEVVMLENDLILRICEGDCAIGGDAKVQIGGNFQACRFKGVKENDAFPRCVDESVSKNGVEYSVIAGSNQVAKKRGVEI